MRTPGMTIVAMGLGALYLVIVLILYNHQEHNTIQEANKWMALVQAERKALFQFVEKYQKPVIYGFEDQGILSRDFFDPNLLSFTYISRNIHNIYEKEERKQGRVPYIYRIAVTNPRNQINQATAHELAIIDRFRQGKTREISEIIDRDGERFFVRYTPLNKTGKSCLRCHGDPKDAPADLLRRYGDQAGFHIKEGESRGLLMIGIPLATIEKEAFSSFLVTSLVVFGVFVLFFFIINTLINKARELHQRDEVNKKLIGELEQSLRKIKQLEGLLPICSSCKQIRDRDGNWQRLEKYIGEHSEARFSHGLCPDCAKKLYPELYEE